MSNWSKKLLEYLSNNYSTTNESIESTKEITLDGCYIGVITSEAKNYLH